MSLSLLSLFVCIQLQYSYGDLAPGSTPERMFTSFYVLLGLVILSAVISAISDKIHQNYMKKSNERIKRAASQMRNVKAQEGQRSSVMEFLDVEEELSEQDEASRGNSFSQHLSGKFGMSTTDSPKADKQNSKKIIEAMQKLNMDMFDEDLQDLKISAKRNFVLVWVMIFFGCLIMLAIEDWNFGDSFYWAIVTITTVGFGDMVPTTDKGKIFTIFYCLVGVAMLARVMNDLIAYPLVKKEKQSEMKVMMQFGGELSEDTLQHILTDDFFDRIPNLRQKKESISKSEFILLVLGMMNKLNDKDVIIVSKIFEMLDKQQEGVLSADTIRHQMTTARLQEEQDVQLQDILSSSSKQHTTKSLALMKIPSKLKEKVNDIKGSVAKKTSSNKSGGYEKVGNESMANPLIDQERFPSGDISEHSKRGTYNLDMNVDNNASSVTSNSNNSNSTNNMATVNSSSSTKQDSFETGLFVDDDDEGESSMNENDTNAY